MARHDERKNSSRQEEKRATLDRKKARRSKPAYQEDESRGKRQEARYY